MKIVINLPLSTYHVKQKKIQKMKNMVVEKRANKWNARTPNEHIAKIAALPSFENNY